MNYAGRSRWKGRESYTVELFVFMFRKGLLLNICFSEYRAVSFWLESQEESTAMTVFKKSGWCGRGDERLSVPSGTLTMDKETIHRHLKDVNTKQSINQCIPILQGRVIGENERKDPYSQTLSFKTLRTQLAS